MLNELRTILNSIIAGYKQESGCLLTQKFSIWYWSGPIFSQIDVGYPLRLSNSTGFKFCRGKKDTLVESIFCGPQGPFILRQQRSYRYFFSS